MFWDRKFPMKEGDDDLPQRVHFFDSRARNTLNQLYIPYAIDLGLASANKNSKLIFSTRVYVILRGVRTYLL